MIILLLLKLIVWFVGIVSINSEILYSDESSVYNLFNGPASSISKWKDRRLSIAYTGTGSATSYATKNQYSNSASCGGNAMMTYTYIGGYCIHDVTNSNYYMTSFKSDNTQVTRTTIWYQEATCTTPLPNIFISTINYPKACVDTTNSYGISSERYITAAAGNPAKDFSGVSLVDFFLSIDCTGPVYQFVTQQNGICIKSDNGIKSSYKTNCHNSTHVQSE